MKKFSILPFLVALAFANDAPQLNENMAKELRKLQMTSVSAQERLNRAQIEVFEAQRKVNVANKGLMDRADQFKRVLGCPECQMGSDLTLTRPTPVTSPTKPTPTSEAPATKESK